MAEWDTRYKLIMGNDSQKTNPVQAMGILDEFIQDHLMDNALKDVCSRKLNRDVRHALYLPVAERENTKVWHNWYESIQTVLNK